MTSLSKIVPTSALAAAADKNFTAMTVGLLTAESTSKTNQSTSKSQIYLPELDEASLIEQLYHGIEFLKRRIDRPCLKLSKVCESYLAYFEQYADFDPLMTLCEPSNPCKRISFFSFFVCLNFNEKR